MAKCTNYCEFYRKFNLKTEATCVIRGLDIIDIQKNYPEIYCNCEKFVQGKHYSKQPAKPDNETDSK